MVCEHLRRLHRGEEAGGAQVLTVRIVTGWVFVNIEDMDTTDKARGEAAVRDNDIVMFFDGSHYNALTWQFSSDESDEAAHAEAHFNNEFDND